MRLGLKPCPFCGGRPTDPYYYDPFDGYMGKNLGVYMICCEECPARLSGGTRQETIEAWNRRTEPGEIDFDYEAEDE